MRLEGQAGLGAVPGDELVDGVLVHTARGWRAEAIEHGQLAVIQIRQAKHPATVIRLDFQFANGEGLPCRRIGTTAQTVWAMQAWALVRSGGILSAIAWFRKLSRLLSQKIRTDMLSG